MNTSNALKSSPIGEDTILPDQFWERRRPDAGAIALLWTIFLDGIRSYQEAVARGATCGRDFRETERWILSRDAGHITSFRNLCEVFGIDPVGLQRRLMSLRHDRA